MSQGVYENYGIKNEEDKILIIYHRILFMI